MPNTEVFGDTFALLRGVRQRYASKMIVQIDTPGHYQLSSPSMKDRLGTLHEH